MHLPLIERPTPPMILSAANARLLNSAERVPRSPRYARSFLAVAHSSARLGRARIRRIATPTYFTDPASGTNDVDSDLECCRNARRIDDAFAAQPIALISPVGLHSRCRSLGTPTVLPTPVAPHRAAIRQRRLPHRAVVRLRHRGVRSDQAQAQGCDHRAAPSRSSPQR